MTFMVAGISLMFLAIPAWTYAQGPFTIPRSDLTISGELTFPGKCVARSNEQPKVWIDVPCKARFTVRDGTWVTVENSQLGYFFGFIGQINELTGKPNFIPYKLTPNHAEELEKSDFDSKYMQDPARDIGIGQRVTFEKARGIKLLVTGTGESIFEAPYITDASRYSEEDLKKEFGYTTSSSCCITCQGATVCATSVDTSCGSCGGPGHGFEM
jgi:hypothetical protein